MKYLFSILLLFGFVAANAQATYPMRRTNGNAIVTDVALTATEYFRLPTFNAAVPNLGSYADSSGRILFNLFDSNLLVRNNGSYLFFQPSTKTVNLLGAQTIIGAKQFNAVTTFNSTTTFGGVATFNSTIAAGGEIQPATDIKWSNNTGFGLKGSDNNRFLSYTTAGGVVVGLSSAKVDIYHGATLALRTTSGGGINVTGTISRTSGTSSQYLMADGSVRTNVNSSIDTGRAAAQIVTGGSLNKVRDSLANLIVAPNIASGTYTPTLTAVTNVSSTTATTCQYMRVGNTVTISGKVRVTGTTAGTTATISITLPIAQNNFANSYEAAGSGGFIASNTYYGATLASNSGAQTIALSYIPTSLGNDEIYFTVTYQIK